MHWTKDSHHRNSGSPFSDLSKLSDCNDKLPFVCEKYNVSSLEKYSPDSAAKVRCTGKWIPFQNKVKRELLPCGSHDCFHSACTAWGRKAAQPDASLRGASSMPGTRITGTIDLLSQVRDAYRSLYSVVPNTKVAEVALTMAQVHWMVAANPTPWGNWSISGCPSLFSLKEEIRVASSVTLGQRAQVCYKGLIFDFAPVRV